MIPSNQPSISQADRNHHKHCSQNQVKGKDTKIKTQQLPIFEYITELRRIGLCIVVHMAVDRSRHHLEQYDNTQQGQCPCQPENAGDSNPPIQYRADNDCHHKGDTDTHAEGGHRLGALLLSGEVCQQCHRSSRNRPSPL